MTQHEANKDLMRETDAQMLARLSDDAHAWAAEFRKTAINLGYSDMDEGWLISWFSNVIVQSQDVVRRASRSGEFVIVPREPTDEQVAAGWKHVNFKLESGNTTELVLLYKAMLASAPAAPVGEECANCGSTQTIEEIRRDHPTALSCCPERDMRPATPPVPAGEATGITPDQGFAGLPLHHQPTSGRGQPSPVPADVVKQASEIILDDLKDGRDTQGAAFDATVRIVGLLSSSGEAMRYKKALCNIAYSNAQCAADALSMRRIAEEILYQEKFRALPSVEGEGK